MEIKIKKTVFHFFCAFMCIPSHCQHPSTLGDPLSDLNHELVSNSLTIATLPLLLLTKRCSKSLINEIPGPHGEKSSSVDRLNNCISDSADSLQHGKTPPSAPRSPQTIPRIIVISPTSESSLINYDSIHSEDSFESMENNLFVSLNFSSEVFEAVKLLSWPAGLLTFFLLFSSSIL